MNCPPIAAALIALIGGVPPVAAQTAQAPLQLDPVVVSAQRSLQPSFTAPAAISAIDREVLESGGPQVNLSEALNRVPGISVLNRQNYAQDLQLSIRGFGARSTFGIRGVRLIVDGIPATMPDGQGQASSIALSSAQRIEVLRGPMAQLYGNAAGGVVQVFSGAATNTPTAIASSAFGPHGLHKLGVGFSAGGERDSVLVDASRFATHGYREHSAAERTQLNAKWERVVDATTRFSLVANVLDQPLSQDPLGLTRAQWQADPRQAVQLAKDQDARKSVAQQQIGALLEHRFGERTTVSARIHFGSRELDNALSVPLAAQQAPTSSGGIVQFQRSYRGLGVQLTHELPIEEGRALRLTGGIELDRMSEDRQGYLNDGGVQGALKRDELNHVGNDDVYLQAAWDVTRSLTATAGARSSRVRFRSNDRFIAAGNPDDSGRVGYDATNPVLGLSWRASPSLLVYANAGRGFETPTFTELAYRPNGATGLNFDLQAAGSRHAEVGAKWRLGESQRIDMALFDIRSRDEIVVDTNQGGRSTFKNAGRTSRRGIELQHLGRYAGGWRSTLSLTALRARFDDGFVSGSGAAAVTVPAGNRLPGTPQRSAFAELAWAPAGAWGGFNAGLEAVHVGKLYVNDANSDAAPAATTLNLRAGFRQAGGGWTFTQLLRVDNATDKRYAGSVIVNDANQRFFEPGLPRHWTLALTARHEFR